MEAILKVAEYVLEMKNISKEFPGVKALDNVSLKLKAGSIHALVGENGAGKSTLMKCLFGIYNPNKGEIFIDGNKVEIPDAKTALGKGISMIHQELYSVRQRNVMDNFWLGRYPMKRVGPAKMIDEKKMKEDTKTIFADLGIDIDPAIIAGRLSVSQLQLIEIAKAVSYHSHIIVMDEPTSSLTEDEVDHLFEIIDKLKKRNVAIIYISHKMEEILRISDEVTIMRDGKYIGTWDAKDMTTNMIISKMVGRDMTQRFPERERHIGEVILKAEDLTSIHPKSFRNVSFELRRGEVLGVGGLVGAQRTEVIEALFGLRALSKGKIFINDKEVKINSPIEAKKHKIALLTEERRATGIFPILSVVDNTSVAHLASYLNKFHLINDKRRKTDAVTHIKKMNIKTPTVSTLIQSLSGGNQQKVLVARWLLTDPDILLLDEPTRGIDVGAKYEIYTIINDLVGQGKSVIMISSEMPELIGMSDRIMVMSNGILTGIVDREEANEELIMTLAAKGLE